ncbi:MAG: Flp family type IVb pilin [Vampirovibrionia bacterium]
MRDIKGSALSQYAIIIGLVALAVIPVFVIFGNTIVSQFSFFKECLSPSVQTQSSNQSTSNTSTTTASDLKTGPLGGTTQLPVKECTDGKCDIDFGEYILTGIPENFKNYVESAGTSGGTDKLLSLLGQMADQLEADGNQDGADELRELANVGYALSLIESKVEDLANKCKTEDEPQYSFSTNYSGNLYPEANSMLNAINDLVSYDYNAYYSSHSEFPKTLQAILYNALPDKITENSDTKSLGYALISKYEAIMASDKFSDSTKAVTQGIIKDITSLSFSLTASSYYIDPFSRIIPDSPFAYSDPFSEDRVNINYISDDMNTITNPTTGARIDLNSYLICQSSNNTSDGSKCE